MKPGKQLGGAPPRRGGRFSRGRKGRREGSRPAEATALLGVLAFGLFVLGAVAGFGWGLDRQLRGGILRQGAEAQGRPDWVRLEALPAYIPQMFVGVVDPGFLRAGTLRAGKEGTTLARELVRQVHLLPSGLWGEAQEVVMAPVLEQRARKDELLEMYLNRVYLGRAQGHPVYGLHHAAREYFGKQPRELSLSEAATLAGLLLEPRIENPENDAGAVGARRREVLQVMRIGGLISDDQFQAALREPLGFQPGLDEAPMTRPVDFGRAPQVIRLPEALRPRPDSLSPGPAAES